MKTIEVLNDDGKFSSSGMIINSNVESQCLSDETFKLELGVAIKRRKLIETDDTESLNVNIKYDDKDIEALIYVHLYPYGKGHWYKRQNGMT